MHTPPYRCRYRFDTGHVLCARCSQLDGTLHKHRGNKPTTVSPGLGIVFSPVEAGVSIAPWIGMWTRPSLLQPAGCFPHSRHKTQKTPTPDRETKACTRVAGGGSSCFLCLNDWTIRRATSRDRRIVPTGLIADDKHFLPALPRGGLKAFSSPYLSYRYHFYPIDITSRLFRPQTMPHLFACLFHSTSISL